MHFENEVDPKPQHVTRIAIIEPHPLVAEGLRHTLIKEFDFDVVGNGQNCIDAVQIVDQVRPDVLLMNLRLPDGDSLETVKLIHEKNPDIHVVMRTDDKNCRELPSVIEAGSVGLISLERSCDEIVTALRSAARGELLVRRHELGELVERLQKKSKTSNQLLSARELEVLRLLAQAKPTSQIAQDLYLSVHTVRNHTRNILFKFGAHSKMEAIALALQSGVLAIGDISYGDPSEDPERELAS